MAKIIRKERAYNGFFKVDRLLIDPENGGAPLTREVFERGASAALLPYDPVRNRVLVVSEVRAGALAAGFDSGLARLGPIAGSIEPGETAIANIQHEALEEAGLDLSSARLLGGPTTMVSPGGTSEIIHHFIAVMDLPDELDGSEYGLGSENEHTVVRLMDVGVATDSIWTGVTNGLLTTLLLTLPAFQKQGVL